jgi:hypothetical protein
MDLTSRDEYFEYLKDICRTESVNKALETASHLLVSKDLRIRNLQQAVKLYQEASCLLKKRD